MGKTKILKCVVPGCHTKSALNKTFSKFPRNYTSKFYNWLQIIGIKTLKTRRNYICKSHFAPECFTESDSIRLNSVPSIFPSKPISKAKTILNNLNDDDSTSEDLDESDSENDYTEKDVRKMDTIYLLNKELIEEVKLHELLYNRRHTLFYNQNEKDKVWKKIAQKLNSDVEICKIHWEKLLENYLSAVRANNWHFDEIIVENEKPWKLYESLKFLQKHFQSFSIKRKDLDFCSGNVIPNKRLCVRVKKYVPETSLEKLIKDEPEPVLTYRTKLYIIQLISEGKDIKEIVKEFNLKETTIKRLYKNAEAVRENNVEAKGILTLEDKKIQKMEEILTNWVCNMNNKRLPLNSKIIKNKAKNLYYNENLFEENVNNVDDNFKLFNASDKWFKEWFDKHSKLHDTKLSDYTDIFSIPIGETKLSAEMINVTYENILKEEEIEIVEMYETFDPDPLNSFTTEDETQSFTKEDETESLTKENETQRIICEEIDSKDTNDHEEQASYGETDSKEFNEALIKEIKAYKILYDGECNMYSSKENSAKKARAWDAIAKKLNKNVVECQSRWRYLRVNYLVLARATNWADEIQGMNNFEYYKSLTFLRESIKSKEKLIFHNEVTFPDSMTKVKHNDDEIETFMKDRTDLSQKMEELLTKWIFTKLYGKQLVNVKNTHNMALSIIKELKLQSNNPKIKNQLFHCNCTKKWLNNLIKNCTKRYNDEKEDIQSIDKHIGVDDGDDTKDVGDVTPAIEEAIAIVNIPTKDITEIERNHIQSFNEEDIDSVNMTTNKLIKIEKVSNDDQSFDDEICSTKMPIGYIKRIDDDLSHMFIKVEDSTIHENLFKTKEQRGPYLRYKYKINVDHNQSKTELDLKERGEEILGDWIRDLIIKKKEITDYTVISRARNLLKTLKKHNGQGRENKSWVPDYIWLNDFKERNFDNKTNKWKFYKTIEPKILKKLEKIPKNYIINVDPNQPNTRFKRLDLKKRGEEILIDWIVKQILKKNIIDNYHIMDRARRILFFLRKYNSQGSQNKTWIPNNRWFKTFKKRYFDTKTNKWNFSTASCSSVSGILQDENIINLEEQMSSCSIEQQNQVTKNNCIENQDNIYLQSNIHKWGLNKCISKKLKLDIILSLEHGCKPLQVAKIFDIGVSTVYSIYARVDMILSEILEEDPVFFLQDNRKILPELIKKMEEVLNFWIFEMNKTGIPVEKGNLKQEAICIFNKLKEKSNNPEDSNLEFAASSYWFRQYMMRYPIEENPLDDNDIYIYLTDIESTQSDYLLKMQELLTYWLIDINARKLKSSEDVIINKAKGILCNFHLKSNNLLDYYTQYFQINKMWFDAYVKHYGIHYNTETNNWVCDLKMKSEAQLKINSINNYLDSQSKILYKDDKKQDETKDNTETIPVNVNFEKLHAKSVITYENALERMKKRTKNVCVPLKIRIEIRNLFDKGRTLTNIAGKYKLPKSAILKAYINSHKPTDIGDDLLTPAEKELRKQQSDFILKMETELTDWIHDVINKKSFISKNDWKFKAKDIFAELKQIPNKTEDLQETSSFKSFEKLSGKNDGITNMVFTSVPRTNISSEMVTSESSILSPEKCITTQSNLIKKMESALTDWMISTKSYISKNVLISQAQNIFEELKQDADTPEELKEIFIADDVWFKSFQKRSGFVLEMDSSELPEPPKEICSSSQKALITKLETLLIDWIISKKCLINENEVKRQAQSILEKIKKTSNHSENLKENFIDTWFEFFKKFPRIKKLLSSGTISPTGEKFPSIKRLLSSGTISPVSTGEKCMSLQSELLGKMENELIAWMINTKSFLSENDLKCKAKSIFEELKKNSNSPKDLKEIFVADEIWFESFQKRSGIKKVVIDENTSSATATLQTAPITNILSEMVVPKPPVIPAEKCVEDKSDLLLRMEKALTDWMISTNSFISENNLKCQAQNIFEEFKKNSTNPEDSNKIFIADETWFKSFQNRFGIKVATTEENIPSEIVISKGPVISAEKCIGAKSDLLLRMEKALTDWMIKTKSLISENSLKCQAQNIFEECKKYSKNPEDLKETFVADETWFKSFQTRSGIKKVLPDVPILPATNTNISSEIVMSKPLTLLSEKCIRVQAELILKMELALTDWMITKQTLTSENDLKCKASKIFEKLKKNSNNPEDVKITFAADDTWLKSFQNRFGIKKNIVTDATILPVPRTNVSSEIVTIKSPALSSAKCMSVQSNLLLQMETALSNWMINTKSFLSENDLKCKAVNIFEELKKKSKNPEDLQACFIPDEIWFKSFQKRSGIKSVVSNVIIPLPSGNISSEVVTSDLSTLSPQKFTKVQSDLLLQMEIALTDWMISTKSFISENDIKRQAQNIFNELKKNSNNPEDLKEIFVADEAWLKLFENRSGIKSVVKDVIISAGSTTKISPEIVSTEKLVRDQTNLLLKTETALTDWIISQKSLVSANDVKCQAQNIFEEFKKNSNKPEDLKEIFVANETWFKSFQKRSAIKSGITDTIISPISGGKISSQNVSSEKCMSVESNLLLKMEKALIDWIINAITFINENDVKCQASIIFELLKGKSNKPEDRKEIFVPDDNWLKSFQKRFGIKIGMTVSTKNISPETVTSKSSTLSQNKRIMAQSDLILKMENAMAIWMIYKKFSSENELKCSAVSMFEELKKKSNKPQDLKAVFVPDESWFKSFQERFGIKIGTKDIISFEMPKIVSCDSLTLSKEKLSLQNSLLYKMEKALANWIESTKSFISDNVVKCQAQNIFEELKKNSNNPEEFKETFVADEIWFKSFQKRSNLKRGISDVTISPTSSISIKSKMVPSESSPLSTENSMSGFNNLLSKMEKKLTDWLHEMISTKSFISVNAVKCKAKIIFDELKKNNNLLKDLKNFIADDIWFKSYQIRAGIKIGSNDLIMSLENVTSESSTLPLEKVTSESLTLPLANVTPGSPTLSLEKLTSEYPTLPLEKVTSGSPTISLEKVIFEFPTLPLESPTLLQEKSMNELSDSMSLLLKMEKALVDWLHYTINTNSFLNENSVRRKAMLIFNDLKIKSNKPEDLKENFVPDDTWFKSFQERYKIKINKNDVIVSPKIEESSSSTLPPENCKNVPSDLLSKMEDELTDWLHKNLSTTDLNASTSELKICKYTLKDKANKIFEELKEKSNKPNDLKEVFLADETWLKFYQERAGIKISSQDNMVYLPEIETSTSSTICSENDMTVYSVLLSKMEKELSNWLRNEINSKTYITENAVRCKANHIFEELKKKSNKPEDLKTTFVAHKIWFKNFQKRSGIYEGLSDVILSPLPSTISMDSEMLKSALVKEMEKSLFSWMVDMNSKNLPLYKPTIKNKAKSLFYYLQVNSSNLEYSKLKFIATEFWFNSFIKRYDIKSTISDDIQTDYTYYIDSKNPFHEIQVSDNDMQFISKLLTDKVKKLMDNNTEDQIEKKDNVENTVHEIENVNEMIKTNPVQMNNYNQSKKKIRKKKIYNFRSRISVKSKMNIINLLENNHDISSVSKKFGLSKGTIYCIYKNADKIREGVQTMKEIENSVEFRSILIRKVEKLLIPWIKNRNKSNLKTRSILIREKALNLFNNLQKKTKNFKRDSFNASYGWFRKFKKRYGIELNLINTINADIDKSSNSNEALNSKLLSNENIIISLTDESKTAADCQTIDDQSLIKIDNNEKVEENELKKDNSIQLEYEEEKLKLVDENDEFKLKELKEVDDSKLENEKFEIINENEEKDQPEKSPGTENLSELNKTISAMNYKIGEDCKCSKYKCFEQINSSERESIIKNFNLMADRHSQDSYLASLITPIPIKKRRNHGKKTPYRRQSCYCYRIRSETNNKIIDITVCHKAFISIHGISNQRLCPIKQSLLITGLPPKIKTKLRKCITAETHEKVKSHIESLKGRRAHNSIPRNNSKLYLPKELNIKKLHKMYSELNPNNSITYRKYIDILQNEYNISFGYPRSDICSNCDQFKNEESLLRNKLRLTNLTENQRSQIRKERKEKKLQNKIHSKKANIFNLRKKNAKKLASNEDTEAICFNFMQNLGVPNILTNDVYYYSQLNFYMFNVHVLTSDESFIFTYDETIAKKGSNDVLSMLDNFFKNNISSKIRNLHIFCDSSPNQSKNFTIIKFFHSLVNIFNRFDSIRITYPVQGHNLMKCDENIELIKKNVKIELPDEWYDHIKSSRDKSSSFVIIKTKQDIFKNWTSYLEKNHYKKKSPFATRIFEVLITKNLSQAIKLRTTYNGPLHSYVIRDENAGNILQNLKPSYTSLIPLSSEKYNDLMELKKFCSDKAQQFFEELPHFKPILVTNEQELSIELSDDCASEDENEMNFKKNSPASPLHSISSSSLNCNSPTMKEKKSYKITRNAITLKQKLDIIQLLDKGNKAAHIARQLGTPIATINSISRNSDKIRNTIAAGSILSSETMTQIRSTLMQRMEKLLTAWIVDVNNKNLPISSRIIQEKARSLFNDLKENSKISEDAQQTFNGSQGWLERFKKRSVLHSLKMLKNAGANIDGEENSWTGALNITDEPLTNKELITLFGEDDISIKADTINSGISAFSNIEENQNEINLDAVGDNLDNESLEQSQIIEDNNNSRNSSSIEENQNEINLDGDVDNLDNESLEQSQIIEDNNNSRSSSSSSCSSDDEKKSNKNFPFENLTDAMKQLDIAMELIQKYDKDTNRSKTVRLSILESVECYRNILQEKEMKILKNNKDSHYKTIPFTKESPTYLYGYKRNLKKSN